MYTFEPTPVVALFFAVLLFSSTVFAQNAGHGVGASSQNRIGRSVRLQNQSLLLTQDGNQWHDRRLERLYRRDLKREQERDRIYGANLMSSAERTQYEAHLRSLPANRPVFATASSISS